MERFLEAMCAIIIVLLAYIILRQEKFISVASASAARKFNFEGDARGYSQADKFLKTQLNY